jgi:hypothetical protein
LKHVDTGVDDTIRIVLDPDVGLHRMHGRAESPADFGLLCETRPVAVGEHESRTDRCIRLCDCRTNPACRSSDDSASAVE